MAEPAAFHEFQLMAAYVTSHPRLQAVVQELEDDLNADKTLFDEANKDPKKHLNDRGFDLPEEWRVEIRHGSPLSVAVCVSVGGETHCVSVEVNVEVI
jgi:hypothetical protein